MFIEKIRVWIALLLICTFVHTAFAGDTKDWTNVTAIKQGALIGVTAHKHGTMYGTLSLTTTDLLAVEAKSGEVKIPQRDVRAVYTVTPRQQTYRKVGYGCAIAFAGLAAVNLGLTLKAVHDLKTATPGSTVTEYQIGFLPMIGTGVAALIFGHKGRGTKVYSNK